MRAELHLTCFLLIATIPCVFGEDHASTVDECRKTFNQWVNEPGIHEGPRFQNLTLGQVNRRSTTMRSCGMLDHSADQDRIRLLGDSAFTYSRLADLYDLAYDRRVTSFLRRHPDLYDRLVEEDKNPDSR
jgi:hypothetical protein